MSTKNDNREAEPCWPFWNVIYSEECPSDLTPEQTLAYERDKARRTYFTRIINLGQLDVFERLKTVGCDALNMVKHRSIGEMRTAAKQLRMAIDSYVEEYIENETASYIRNLTENGGWELNYLPDGSEGTEPEVRELIENWSVDWDDVLNLPNSNDVSDLTALTELLAAADNHLVSSAFVKGEEHELYAVLALMILGEVARSFTGASPIPKSVNEVKSIGHVTIAAIEVIAHAQRTQFEGTVRRSIESKQPEVLALELARIVKERATNAANKKHWPINQAKLWVCEEWKRLFTVYSGNKSEFSRIYMVFVRQKFNDANGKPLQVTDKTIRDVWLKNYPSAGK